MAVHLCTTVHPGVLPFLDEFLASVAAQTDQAFDIWVALDGVSAGTVDEAVAALPPADASEAGAGRPGGERRLGDRLRPVSASGTPAQVRDALFARAIEAADPDDLLVLADADDVLEAARGAAAPAAPPALPVLAAAAAGVVAPRAAPARAAPRAADVSACALRLIDAGGADLGAGFCELADSSPATLDELLPRGNVFGLSNSSYRAAALRCGLPLPAAAVAVDWYLVTAAWLAGARLAVDPTVRMRYRRHGTNLAPVAPPFDTTALERATAVVVRHHELVAEHLLGQRADARAAALRAARRAADEFAAAIEDPAVRDRYLAGLNRLPPPQAWWTMVAHPALEDLWRT